MTSGTIDSAGAQAGDYHLMLSSRTFNMCLGDIAHFTVAYSVVSGVPEMSGASGTPAMAVDQLVEPLFRYYYSPSGFQGVAAVPTERTDAGLALVVAPNPAGGGTDPFQPQRSILHAAVCGGYARPHDAGS